MHGRKNRLFKNADGSRDISVALNEVKGLNLMHLLLRLSAILFMLPMAQWSGKQSCEGIALIKL